MCKIKAFKTVHEANAGDLTNKFMRYKSKVKRCNVESPTIIFKKIIGKKEILLLMYKLQRGPSSLLNSSIRS